MTSRLMMPYYTVNERIRATVFLIEKSESAGPKSSALSVGVCSDEPSEAYRSFPKKNTATVPGPE